MFKCSNFQMLNYSKVWIFKSLNVQMLKFSNVQMFKCSNIQMFKCSNVQILQRMIQQHIKQARARRRESEIQVFTFLSWNCFLQPGRGLVISLGQKKLALVFGACRAVSGWIFGYLAIWLRAKNMIKWGIPEKSIKNVAQRRWPYVRRSLPQKVMARNWFLEIPPAISPAWEGVELQRKQNVFWNQWSSGNNLGTCTIGDSDIFENKNHPIKNKNKK